MVFIAHSEMASEIPSERFTVTVSCWRDWGKHCAVFSSENMEVKSLLCSSERTELRNQKVFFVKCLAIDRIEILAMQAGQTPSPRASARGDESPRRMICHISLYLVLFPVLFKIRFLVLFLSVSFSLSLHLSISRSFFFSFSFSLSVSLSLSLLERRDWRGEGRVFVPHPTEAVYKKGYFQEKTREIENAQKKTKQKQEE